MTHLIVWLAALSIRREPVHGRAALATRARNLCVSLLPTRTRLRVPRARLRNDPLSSPASKSHLRYLWPPAATRRQLCI